MSAIDGELVARVFPGAYFAFIAAFYTWRIILLGRRRGASPIHRGQPRSRPWRNRRLFVAMRLVILALMLGRALWPPLDRWLVPLGPLWLTPVMLTGDLLLALSFAGVLLVHRQMGDAWQSGMAPEGPPRLVTEGAYAWVRHPSFSLVLLGQLGLFLAVPSLFTLICLLLGGRTLLSQAHLEDLQLRERFGAEFDRYATQVPPWPWPMARRSEANYKGGLAHKDFIP